MRVGQQHQGRPRTRRTLLNKAAALGLLIEAPSHGYMLFRRFAGWMGGDAPRRHQVIYELLDELKADGWIAPETDESEDRERQIRTRYLVTPAGRAMLVRWVESGFGTPETLEEFVLRMRCAAALRDVEAIHATLDRIADAVLLRQQELAPPSRELPIEPKLLVDRLLERRREASLDAELQWVEWAKAMVTSATARGRARADRGE